MDLLAQKLVNANSTQFAKQDVSQMNVRQKATKLASVGEIHTIQPSMGSFIIFKEAAST
jgi:hypothetical protein